MVQQQFMDNIQATLQKQYLRNNNIYTLVTQHYLDNPDHRIAQDAKLFCKELTDFFRSILKPLFDVVIFAVALSSNGGYGAPAFLVSYYVLVGTLMSVCLPNFAYLVAKSEEKEGNLRANHNQLIQHAEEVAFYGGEDIERQHADRLMKIITKHERLIKNVKWWGSLLDKLLIKYGATCIGYLVCGASVAEKKGTLDTAQLTELYLTNTQLYIPFSVAIGKLLLLRKKIGALCGSTHRVGELREVLHRLSCRETRLSLNNYIEINDSEQILFSNADIVAPDGNVILNKLTLNIQRHNNILIMGSNGSGKSAIVRALSQLWPISSGTITTPSYSTMLFLPQRAYLPPGTLRAQMVYPLIESEVQERISDEALLNYVDLIGIPHVVEREGGLDSVRNWHEVLSGGERQRIALIRVLVNNPIFAILDECTSAISQDDEVRLYAILQKAGITLVTISHREALKSIHETLLELDGTGRYQLTSLRMLSTYS
ncbi:ATP-binding protein cassette, subfamily D (ALD), member 3 [Strigomonas culicis]|nr:ATP-binding protein cassette, subfamily D (ALD), member 3 [Strigomonas culicis]|eukprot:EPY32112.1 ATP-binding protein cassette, subfamily D (ALD), member 3 [Strigomonas culicis]